MITLPIFLITIAMFAFLFFVVACIDEPIISTFTGDYTVEQINGKMSIPHIVECWAFDAEHFYLSGIEGRWRREVRDEGKVLVADYIEMVDNDNRIWRGTGIWHAKTGMIDFNISTIFYETKIEKDVDTDKGISWHTQYEKKEHLVWKMIEK